MSRLALRAARIFDGERMRDNAVLLIEDGRVLGVASADEARGEEPVEDATLAPGLVDWQVNGGGGALFNDEPTPEGLARIASAHAASGTTAFLPTLITAPRGTMDAAADAVAAALRTSAPGVVGVHFEGPHIAHARRGAHDPAHIRPPEPADLARLARSELGARVATAAPEAVPPETIAAMTRSGVRVSLGHSDASFEAASAAFAAGACAATHLFNAMSGLGHRAPGLVGAALDRPGVAFGLIADGVHVHAAALRLAMRAAPNGATLVSDAMPTVGAGTGGFTLGGRAVTLSDGKLTLPDGTLAGAHLCLADAVRYAVETLGRSPACALSMATLRPARLLGLAPERGTLRSGARADIVAFDRSWRPAAVWIGGRRLRTAGRAA